MVSTGFLLCPEVSQRRTAEQKQGYEENPWTETEAKFTPVSAIVKLKTINTYKLIRSCYPERAGSYEALWS